MSRRLGYGAGILGGVALLAGCATQAPPPPPPPPPPKPIVVIIPPRPLPPEHAPADLAVPPIGANGMRVSVNREITPAQMAWNLRSAYNVAALNCAGPEHAEILPNYRLFLKSNAKALKKLNTQVDAEFREAYGKDFIVPRESYMTEVYNHFALPPTMPEFCAAVLAMSREGRTVKPAALQDFAQQRLPAIEAVFDAFYQRYDAYRAALADWTARYGPDASAPPAVASVSVGPRRD